MYKKCNKLSDRNEYTLVFKGYLTALTLSITILMPFLNVKNNLKVEVIMYVYLVCLILFRAFDSRHSVYMLGWPVNCAWITGNTVGACPTPISCDRPLLVNFRKWRGGWLSCLSLSPPSHISLWLHAFGKWDNQVSRSVLPFCWFFPNRPMLSSLTFTSCLPACLRPSPLPTFALVSFALLSSRVSCYKGDLPPCKTQDTPLTPRWQHGLQSSILNIFLWLYNRGEICSL